MNNTENKIERVTVKPDTKWIYAGKSFKVLDVEPEADIYKDLSLGRRFKLCLKGTEFENKHPLSPYTYIHEHDLIIEQPQRKDEPAADTTPLWRRLNEERIAGTYKNFSIASNLTHPFRLVDIEDPYNTCICEINCPSHTNYKEVMRTGEYLAMASNNLHILAEALIRLNEHLDNMKRAGYFIEGSLVDIDLKKSKEALSGIS